MCLKSECPGIQSTLKLLTLSLLILRLCVINKRLAVNFELDPFSANDYFLGVPLIVFDSGSAMFSTAYKLLVFFGILVGNIHLTFVTIFWPSRGLELGMEINSRITTGSCLHFSNEMKIFKRGCVTLIEKMTPWPIANQHPIEHFPAISILFCSSPATQSFTVEKRSETLGIFSLAVCKKTGGKRSIAKLNFMLFIKSQPIESAQSVKSLDLKVNGSS